MRWLDQDEGGVVVIVAVSMVVLFGMGALVLDVGNLFWERRQLQNGADAGALAAAQDLASGESADAARAQARTYTSANNSRDAYMEQMSQPTSNSVRVETITGNAGGSGVLDAFLAGIIGNPDYFATAEATATWGTIGGAATLPLTFSYCEWEELVGDVNNPTLPSGTKILDWHDTTSQDCTGPAGHYAPGGWGWLNTNGDGTCTADVEQGVVGGKPGVGVSSLGDGCTQAFFQSLIGQTVLIPIFEQVTGAGNNGTYLITGFAAVEIEGYKLSNGNNWSYNAPSCSGAGNSGTCIQANFVEFVELGDEIDFGSGPDFGTFIVALTG